jgi:hypothetical protein
VHNGRSLHRRLTIGLSLLAAISGGCSVHNLQFRADHRVHIVEPRASSEVRLPLQVRWRATDTAGLRYGVFVDTFPMRPGKTVDSLGICADNNRPRCQNPSYLSQNGIYITAATQLQVDSLADLSANSYDKREVHDIAIILLNGKGQRVGEYSSVVEFYFQRHSA